MILTIDVGNTNIAVGIADGDEWIEHWRLQTAPEKTADEYQVLFQNLLSASGHTLGAVERVVVSSVVPVLTPAIVAVTKKLFGQEPLVVRHDLETGLDPESVPAEMGSDLIANATAAYDRCKGAAIVVDFGTALTFTAVSATGRVLGVSIAPGLRSALKALSSNAAQLMAVEIVAPPTALGRNTVHSIQSGIVFGYVGLVKEVVGRMSAEMDTTPTVIATGGLATTIAPYVESFDEVRPWHTLEGLILLARKNPA